MPDLDRVQAFGQVDQPIAPHPVAVNLGQFLTGPGGPDLRGLMSWLYQGQYNAMSPPTVTAGADASRGKADSEFSGRGHSIGAALGGLGGLLAGLVTGGPLSAMQGAMRGAKMGDGMFGTNLESDYNVDLGAFPGGKGGYASVGTAPVDFSNSFDPGVMGPARASSQAIARELSGEVNGGLGPAAGPGGPTDPSAMDGGGTDRSGSDFKAKGGQVHGPGTSTSDSVPMHLSDREYVLRAATAEQLTPRVLDRLNQAPAAQQRQARTMLAKLLMHGGR